MLSSVIHSTSSSTFDKTGIDRTIRSSMTQAGNSLCVHVMYTVLAQAGRSPAESSRVEWSRRIVECASSSEDSFSSNSTRVIDKCEICALRRRATRAAAPALLGSSGRCKCRALRVRHARTRATRFDSTGNEQQQQRAFPRRQLHATQCLYVSALRHKSGISPVATGARARRSQ